MIGAAGSSDEMTAETSTDASRGSSPATQIVRRDIGPSV
jgi:hypothetical protein